MNTRDKVEQATIIIVAVMATLLSIVDTFELYIPFPILTWVSGKSSTFIVVLLAVIAIYLVLERRSKLDKVIDLMRTIEAKMGGVGIEFLDMKSSFPRQLVKRVQAVQNFILDTDFNHEIIRKSVRHPQDDYRKIRNKKVLKENLAFRRVEVIFHREHFEDLVERLVKFEGCDYLVRHYDAPPQAVPTLHIMSFDNEHFYIGGFYPSDPSSSENVLYIHGEEVGNLLKEYWNVLWSKAKPLNEGKRINIKELERIGSRFDMDSSEVQDLIAGFRSRK